ncbi:MAG: hypothetical protein ABI551_15810 [Polyangiaceae bacterium]
MLERHSFKCCAALVLALAAFGAACSSGLPRPPYSRQLTSALEPVPYEPPPARVEYVPDRPSPDTVWIDGEWIWSGRTWSWKRGRWVVPLTNATFSPWTTVRAPSGMLYLAGGTWRSPDGKDLDAPPAISYGKPTVGSVVDSEGDSERTGRSIKEEKTDAEQKEKKEKKNGKSEEDVPEASGPLRLGPDGGIE